MVVRLIPRSVIQLALAWDRKAALQGRLFHICKGMALVEKGTPTRKTAVYIDGYNLYYGRLHGTPFKWWDMSVFRYALFSPDSKLSAESVDR